VRELWDHYLVPFNRFVGQAVDRAVADYKPDVVLADQYALTAAIAAGKHGVRWATLATGILDLTPPAEYLAMQDWVGSRVAKIRQSAGLPADDDLGLLFSPDLVIATTARPLTGPVPLPKQCVLVGAALGVRRTDPGFDWDWWDPGRRHVLVTAGTLSAHLVDDFTTRLMAALEPMAGQVQVVLNAPAAALPDPPPHVLVAPRVPMLALLPRLDAVVCQSGQSTVSETLAHGVPLVVAPIRTGELVVAQQVTRAGAGVAVSFTEAGPAQLAAAVTAVLDDPGYRENAHRISEQFAAAGGTATAAAHLAALATGTGAGDADG
jgi:UDP:flavonoid glycosyltransferase YjiC (YdhE family)